METFWIPASDFQQAHPRQVRFEYLRVKMVLTEFNLARSIPAMIAAFKATWGQERLSFESFHKFFPTFPVILEAQSFFATSEMNRWARLKTWISAFSQTFVSQRYHDVYAKYLQLCDRRKAVLHEVVPPELRGRPLGMIFPWGGIKGGLIMHNGQPPAIGTAFVHRDLEDGVPRTYIVEHFGSWLRSVRRLGWTPQSALPAREPAPKSLLARGAVLRPWMVRACGTRDAYVLSWLVRVCGPHANAFESRFCDSSQGIHGVTIKADRLARELGLDIQQINRSLKKLAEQELITVKTLAVGKWRGSLIRLNRANIQKLKQ